MSLTYKEIQDTFNALKKTANYLEKEWVNIEGFFKEITHIVFVGCGSSYSNAKSYAMIFGMNTGKHATALAAGDILLHTVRYKNIIDGAVVVFISRSGKTSELIKAFDAMISSGFDIKTAAFVCAENTPLGDKSDFVLSTPWAFDESVCQTRCVTNAYFIAAYITAKITGNTFLISDMRMIITMGHTFLEKAEICAKVFAIQKWTHAIVLADAELEGIAEEGALVFKEVCQLPSSYHHMLDVRHGPMVLICKETLVIAVLGASCELEISLLRDISEKGANVIAFSDVPLTQTKLEKLEGIQVISFGEPLSYIAKGIPLIILCQMIAYYKSKETGTNPDKPAGLDPWISL